MADQAIDERRSRMRSARSLCFVILSSAMLLLVAEVALAAGEEARDVDTTGLKKLGSEWLKVNPYDPNDKRAVEIGAAAFNENCARCHGLGAVYGGIAPDLRFLPEGEEGDEVFSQKVQSGSTRDGRVLMPPFKDALSQETLWAIRTWLITVREE
jgi:cytochrome c-550 PedF